MVECGEGTTYPLPLPLNESLADIEIYLEFAKDFITDICFDIKDIR